MAEIDEQEQRFMDRFLNASFSFWNSLIVLNSLLIGAISILFSLDPKISRCIILPLFSFGVLSIVLLVWNFLVFKGIYYSILNVEDKYKNVPTEKLDLAFQKGIKKTLNQRKWVKIREIISLVFTGLCLVYIFFAIITEY